METKHKETVKYTMRFTFDHPKTTTSMLIEIMEAMKSIDDEMYLEMRGDLISEGIIGDF